MIQLEDIEFASLLPGSHETQHAGRHTTHFGHIQTHDGQALAYTKILPENKLVVEIVCSLIGRAIGLPIPKPYITRVLPTSSPTLASRSMIAFSVEDARALPYAKSIQDEYPILGKLLRWPHFYLCAAFDQWIGNQDRLPSNLLFASDDGEFYLIDHEDALSDYLSPSTSIKNPLLRLAIEGSGQLDIYRLRKRVLDASGIFQEVPMSDLVNIFKTLDSHIPGSQEMATKISMWLSERLPFIPSMISNTLGDRQIDLLNSATKNPSQAHES